MKSESTIVFHMSHAIKMGHPVGKEIIKLVRTAATIPEVTFRHITLYLVSISIHFSTFPIRCMDLLTLMSRVTKFLLS